MMMNLILNDIKTDELVGAYLCGLLTEEQRKIIESHLHNKDNYRGNYELRFRRRKSGIPEMSKQSPVKN